MALVTPDKFKGKDAFYAKMVGLLVKDFPQTWASFDDAMADVENTGNFVHRIKGAAGNLDLTEIYRCAFDFECSVREGAPSKERYDMFVKACEELKGASKN